ncbi:predicted protein [Nematostella vectensis]|uniref:Gamma-tubulin complex component n=1 Tax=Nematostella vectensis TaxID=45351 RepID=A7SGC2_NEMVE|nr:predicted protein [Nematostella vectensis]|eukprot:XP_001629307.1 predicted protein [Nematostella vectensis]
MLHELLLALSGCSGGVFLHKSKGGLQVASDLPFIHESEATLLNRICRVGTYYSSFQVFIDKNTQLVASVVSKGKAEFQGLYIQAFCSGLDEVLQGYRRELLSLERDVLTDPNLPLSHVEHRLEKYQVLFPGLASVIDHIESKKAKGCKLLDILYQSCICGVPDVKDALERILFMCHGVLYQQLSAWLLHGLLIDRHDEFLISKVSAADENESIKRTESMSQSNSDLGIPGVTRRQLAEIMESEEKQPIAIQQHYKINADMLPSYIPTRVAEKILFVGDSVKMFEEAKNGKNVNITESIIHDNEEMFLRSLHMLRQLPRFNVTAFESEIDKIRACVAEHLWKLVVEEAYLLKHLNVVKDFFLLGRGELFSSFIEKAENLLKVPPSGKTSHDTNAAFQQVIHKFLPDDDESASLFTLSVDMAGYQAKSKPAPDTSVVCGWDCLLMEYHVQWPLHILFQPSILDKYNTMFRYLLNVKRTQLDLQRVWAIHMGSKHQAGHVCQLTRVWLLRMHMAFLVDNLQYYLQVDVLEAQFSQLLDKINITQDFEAIRLAHDHFITTLMAQSFLLMKPVAHCLGEILSLCQAFCSLLLQVSGTLSDREHAQFDNIAQGYERQSSLLFKILSSVRSHQASPHLAQLLLRIDFNKHFSTTPSSLSAFGE